MRLLLVVRAALTFLAVGLLIGAVLTRGTTRDALLIAGLAATALLVAVAITFTVLRVRAQRADAPIPHAVSAALANLWVLRLRWYAAVLFLVAFLAIVAPPLSGDTIPPPFLIAGIIAGALAVAAEVATLILRRRAA